MNAPRFGPLLLTVAALSGSGPVADDDGTPSKPKHRVEPPFAGRGAFVLGGWTGFSPKGEYFAAYYTIEGQAYVAIWDTARGKLLDKNEAGKGMTNTDYGPPAAFTATGSHLAYLVPGEVRFHPLTTGQKAQVTPVPKREGLRAEPHTSLRLADGKEVQQLMYSTADWRFWHDRCETGPSLKVIRTEEFDTRPVALRSATSADGTRLAWVQGQDILDFTRRTCTVHVREFGKKMVTTLAGEKEGIRGTAIGFSPDGTRLAVGHQDGSLTVWDLANPGERLTVSPPKPGFSVGTVAFSPDGNWVAYGSNDRKGQPNVRIASPKTGKVRWAWVDNQTGVLHLSWNPEGTQLGVLGQHSVTVWEVPRTDR